MHRYDEAPGPPCSPLHICAADLGIMSAWLPLRRAPDTCQTAGSPLPSWPKSCKCLMRHAIAGPVYRPPHLVGPLGAPMRQPSKRCATKALTAHSRALLRPVAFLTKKGTGRTTFRKRWCYSLLSGKEYRQPAGLQTAARVTAMRQLPITNRPESPSGRSC